jgi:glutamine amidotransferase
MCRHLAYLGPSRTLSSLLYEPARSLERQSWNPMYQREGAMNADGWGVGWWDRDHRVEPARYRTAAPMWTDNSFHSVAEVVRADAILAAVRSATPPSPIVVTGNAPFAAAQWLFSLNGFVTGFRGPVGERLRRAVSEARATGIEGSADTEVLFALVLDHLDRDETPSDALTHVVHRTMAEAEARLNLLLGDGASIVATACGNSLFTLFDAGLADGGVLVASEPLDDHPEWERIPDGSLVVARRDHLEVTPLADPGAP